MYSAILSPKYTPQSASFGPCSPGFDLEAACSLPQLAPALPGSWGHAPSCMEVCLLNLGSGLGGGSDLFLAAGASVARAFLAWWYCALARTCPTGPSFAQRLYASSSILAAAKLLYTMGVRPRCRASVSV